MKRLEAAEAKSALHFISGLLFSINGTHVKLSSKVFLVMPKLLKDEVVEQIQNQIIEHSLENEIY
jgi:FtsZ-interacting cell division protein YlmF